MRRRILTFFKKTTVRRIALCGLFILGLIALEMLWTPRISTIRYWTEGEKKQVTADSFPFSVTVRNKPVHIRFSLTARPWHVGIYTVHTKSCTDEVLMNQARLSGVCRNGSLAMQNYAPYLRNGVNEVELIINPNQQLKRSSEVSFSPWIGAFPYRIVWWYTICAAMFCIIAIFHDTIANKRWSITGILAGGGLLRLLYVSITSYSTRAYDTDGHLVYIRHLLTHHWIPPAALAWETHQPPLYYFLMSPLLWLSKTLTGTEVLAMTWMQQCSLLLSLLTLAAALWAGRILFDTSRSRLPFVLFGWLVATYPGLILFSSRINNDVLFQLVAFIFLGCLLRWWKTGTTRAAMITAFVIGVGFLTKGNAYLFVPVFWLAIALRPNTPMNRKIRWIVLSGLCIAAMAGWLLIIRYLENDFDRLLTPGRGRMNSGLTVRNNLMAYLTFNPVQVLLHPYTSTWKDSLGRQDFWVFFFKSSLFGEFSFGKDMLYLSRLLVAFGMGLPVLLGIGLVSEIRKRAFFTAPLLLMLFSLLAGAFTYRFLHPQSPNMDFRFSILLIPVCAALIAAGITGLRSTPIRRISLLWIWLFVGSAAAFFLYLPMVA